MSNLRERLAGLSPEQRMQLVRQARLQKEQNPNGQPGAKQAAPTHETAIPPVSRAERLPLSYAQQRLWFLAQLEGGEVYNVFGAVGLRGALDVAALRRALQAIVQRHEILRTTYQTEDGLPWQVIAPEREVPLPVVDLTGLPADAQAAQVESHMAAARSLPFDLSRDVMLRAQLIALAEEEHLLLLTVHHIATDAWSNNLLMQELATLYPAFAAVSGAAQAADPLALLPPLAIQYADFAHWQRRQETAEDLAYWTEHLRGELPVLNLPTDYARPLTQNHRGAVLNGEIEEELTQALKRLAQEERATLFMLLLAAFKVLLWRWTDQEDLIVGTPSAGRTQPATEGLIGLFLNTLALRTDLSGNPTFSALLARVRTVTLDAFAHQATPFEKLVETLHPERSLGRHPIFETMLNLINVPRHEIQLDGLSIQPVEEQERDAKFAMTLYVSEEAGRLSLQLVYQRALFSAPRMAHFLEQFQTLLAQIAADPRRPIGDYSLVTPTGQALLPDPRLPLDEPAHPPIPTRFVELAQRMPHQPALEWRGKGWSYRQLVESAEEIARALLAGGVAQGDVVAVYAGRSYGAIAGMMGVLMAGGVLLNLADNLPDERQAVMLREAGAGALLFVGPEAARQAHPLAGWGLPTLRVDAETGKPDGPAAPARALPALSGQDPAYIFFTSGTTGTPKGILGNHKGLAHFLAWQRETFQVTPADRSAQLIGFSFDVVLRDIFLPLTSGATLCLPEPGQELEAQEIVAWLRSSAITLLHIVPSLAQSWLLPQAGDGPGAPPLRWTFFAGEPLTDALVRQWRRRFALGRIANLYGPTETTMAKCCYLVPQEPLPGVQPIGAPLPQTQALVLNRAGHLCGIGESGQIVIRTPFRTYGYINQQPAPDKAPGKEKGQGQPAGFHPNHFRADPQDLLYYTGDQGRYRPDGVLEILGRVDDQVKIRGIRVELGEIKAVLDQHPQVRECVVVVRGEGGHSFLAAYVVAAGDAPPSQAELRGYVGRRLPGALVPAAFVFLPALPLTPNGKVNRQALPTPEIVSQAVYRAPRDAAEQRLVEIWQRVLDAPVVGVQDSFFDLGGHSLLAVRLMAAIQRRFDRRLPLAVLFQNPTVEALALHLRREAGERAQAWSPLVKIQPKGSRPPFFCVPGAGGNVLYFYHLARHLGPDQPFIGLQSLGLDGFATPHASVEEMAASYVAAMREVQPHGPYHLGGHSFGGKVAFAMAQQLHRQGQRVGLLAVLDSSAPGSQGGEAVGGWDEARWLVEVAGVISGAMGREIAMDYEALRALEPESQLSAFKSALEAIDFLPADADIHQLRGWVNVFKANWQMVYSPQEVSSLPIALFQAAESPPEDDQRLQGWQKLGPVETRIVPGAHMTMLEEPHVATLARELAACLARAAQG